MSDISTSRFLTDRSYREKKALPSLRRALKRSWNGMAREGRESFQALGHILSAADGRSLTSEEKDQVVHQLQDLAKAIPMLAVFMLPGGMLLLPLLLKVLPFDLRLSAFREDDAGSNEGSDAERDA